MILITGDIHGGLDIHKLSNKKIPHYELLTKEDYLIICGDFGLVWDESAEELYWRRWLEDKPFTTLFVDGNHEGFDKLNSYPISEWHGGKVHQISDSIIHLMRGQAFKIDGRKIFTLGGASSHDKETRKENIDWWACELPSEDELAEATATLENNDYSFDYIITHCAPTDVERQIILNLGKTYVKDNLTDYLKKIGYKLNYKRWFCGHYHVDMQSVINSKIEVLYNNIVTL